METVFRNGQLELYTGPNSTFVCLRLRRKDEADSALPEFLNDKVYMLRSEAEADCTEDYYLAGYYCEELEIVDEAL